MYRRKYISDYDRPCLKLSQKPKFEREHFKLLIARRKIMYCICGFAEVLSPQKNWVRPNLVKDIINCITLPGSLTCELKRMMPRVCDPVDRLERELGSVQLYPRTQRALVHPGQNKNSTLQSGLQIRHSFLMVKITGCRPSLLLN